MRYGRFAVLVLIAVMAGCSSAVQITYPPPGSFAHPVDRVDMEGTNVSVWELTLDGSPIDGGPGVGSQWEGGRGNLTPTSGQKTVRVEVQTQPRKAGQGLSDQVRFEFPYLAMYFRPTGGGGGTGSGSTGGSGGSAGASATPVAPTYPIRVGITHRYTVRYNWTAPEPIEVILTPTGGIALNAAMVTIPTGQSEFILEVTGNTVGPFSITASSPGVIPTTINSTVVP